MRALPAPIGALMLAGCVVAPPPAAEPAPQPARESKAEPRPAFPERRLAAPTPQAIRAYVEEVIGDRFGARAVARANSAPSSIITVSGPGRFQPPGPRVNVVLRDSSGWRGWRGGADHALDSAVADEVERLLSLPAFWAEPDRWPATDCPDSGASLMVVRHGALSKVTRQSCAPARLVGRLFGTVLEERAPQP